MTSLNDGWVDDDGDRWHLCINLGGTDEVILYLFWPTNTQAGYSVEAFEASTALFYERLPLPYDELDRAKHEAIELLRAYATKQAQRMLLLQYSLPQD